MRCYGQINGHSWVEGAVNTQLIKDVNQNNFLCKNITSAH